MPAQSNAENYIATLNRDGFVVVKNILSPERLTALRGAASTATKLAREGQWPHVRTVGKQFPPWPPTPWSTGIWGVQHLMNPALPGSDLFTSLYFSSEILDIVMAVLECQDDGNLIMELFNMLVRPESDFELRWHRDDIPSTADPQEETERLQKPAWHAQYNLALFEDDSLVLVPGSHKRPRTDAERNADPFEKILPDQLVVKLEPGDIAFYNNNILHRGVYDSGKERMTLHGSVGHAGGSKLRARNVLQHGVGEWVERCSFALLEGKEKKRAEAMRDRLVEMGRESGSVGYSLQG